MSNMEFASFTSVAAQNPGPFTGRYDDSHTLTLGLRYAFGADEPDYVPPPRPRRPRRPRRRRLPRRPRRLRRRFRRCASSWCISTGIVRT